jgi:hypothetical protein
MIVRFLQTTLEGQEVAFTLRLHDDRIVVDSGPDIETGEMVATRAIEIRSEVGSLERIDPRQNPRRFMEHLYMFYSGSYLRATRPEE